MLDLWEGFKGHQVQIFRVISEETEVLKITCPKGMQYVKVRGSTRRHISWQLDQYGDNQKILRFDDLKILSKTGNNSGLFWGQILMLWLQCQWWSRMEKDDILTVTYMSAHLLQIHQSTFSWGKKSLFPMLFLELAEKITRDSKLKKCSVTNNIILTYWMNTCINWKKRKKQSYSFCLTSQILTIAITKQQYYELFDFFLFMLL